MTKHHIFFIILLGGLRLFAAAEQETLTAVYEQYPPENPYLFVSTIHHKNPPSLLPHVTVDHAIREFDQGVLIGLFEFHGKKEWTGKADQLLQAVDTEALHQKVKKGIEAPHYGRSDIEKNGILATLNNTLNSYRDIFNETLFDEEYKEVNGDPELFTGQLFDKQLQRYSVLAKVLVGMRCGELAFLAQCTSHDSAKYFINFIYGDSSVYWMSRGPRVLSIFPQTQQYIKGIQLPEELKRVASSQACDNAAVATKVLAKRAMLDGWCIDGVKNPTVLCVGSGVCDMLQSKKAKECAEESAP